MATPIVDGLWMLTHRGANMYLLANGEGYTLIDTGFPDSARTVLKKLAALGKPASSIRDIVLTHAHFDHIGSAAELAAASGAQVWVHAADRDIVEGREDFRPTRPAPGLLRHVLFRIFATPGRKARPCAVTLVIADGDVLPGGLRAVHLPGHCAGQVALLWDARGVLFTADVCMNVFGLGDPIAFEDATLGRASQRRMAQLDFDIACFGHGKPKVGAADKAVRVKWPPRRP